MLLTIIVMYFGICTDWNCGSVCSLFALKEVGIRFEPAGQLRPLCVEFVCFL